MHLVILAWLSPWTVAWADDVEPGSEEALERGKELFDNGVTLYDEGRYEDAIVAWTEAHRLTNRAGFLYNIANAYERVGDYEAAIDTLGRYRALARAEERETLDRRLRNLEARLPSPSVEPVVPPPLPVPMPVTPAPADPMEPAVATSTGPSLRGVLGTSLLVSGVAGVGVGAGFGLRSRSAEASALAGCGQSTGGLLCSVGSADDLRTHTTSAAVSDIGFVGGAALSAAGVLLLVTGSRDVAPEVALGPDGAFVGVRVRR